MRRKARAKKRRPRTTFILERVWLGRGRAVRVLSRDAGCFRSGVYVCFAGNKCVLASGAVCD